MEHARMDLWGEEHAPGDARAHGHQSYQRRHARLLREGRHPMTGLPLLGLEGATCGTCAFHVVRGYAGRYHKCTKVPMTHGPATDTRVRWPACALYQRDEPVSGVGG